MAKIYNPTRSMLDPSLFQTMNTSMQNRIQNQANRDKMMMESTRNMLSKLGEAIDDKYAQYKRAKEIGAIADQPVQYYNDPVYKAAREEYIRSGSSSPLQQYMLQKEAQKAKIEEAKQRAKDEEAKKSWHEQVRIAQAIPVYDQYQKEMLTALDNGDMETAKYYEDKMNALQTEFGNVFGGNAEAMKQARIKTKAEEDKRKALEERDARMMAEAEKLEQKEAEEKAANQAENALWVESNVIPTIDQKETYVDENGKEKPVPTATKKQEVKQQILRLLQDKQITSDQANKLTSLVDSIETLEEANKKSIKSATSGFTGTKTKEKLEASEEEKKLADKAKEKLAKGYKLFKEEQDAYNKVYGSKK